MAMNSPQIQCLARFPVSMLPQLENFELGKLKPNCQYGLEKSCLCNKLSSNPGDLPYQNIFDLNMLFNPTRFNYNEYTPSIISTNDSDKKIEIEKLLNLDSNETWIDQSECLLELNHQSQINWNNQENQESVSLGQSKIKEEEMQLKESKEQSLFESQQQQQFYEEEPFDECELGNNEISEEEVLPIFNKLTEQVTAKISNYQEFNEKEEFPLKMDESEFMNDKLNGKIDYAFYKPHQNPNWYNLPANLNLMKKVREQQQNQTKNIGLLLGYFDKIKAIKQEKIMLYSNHVLSNNSHRIKKFA